MRARPSYSLLATGGFFRVSVGLACAHFVVAARAHDSFEITTTARLKPETLVLEITAARSTANQMAGEAGNFAPEQFEAARARLSASALNLFEITAGGQPLRARSAEVALGIEQDVDYVVLYPPPPRGTLQFHARHVRGLGQGYGNVLTVYGADGALLGQQVLMVDDLTLTAEVPAIASAVPPVAGAVPRKFHPGLAVVSAGVIAVLAYWAQRRRAG